MINIIKKLFTTNKESVSKLDAPGRTFKRILTGRYFGCEDSSADAHKVAKAKQEKIDQIKELELIPMYVKYTYQTPQNPNDNKTIITAHVSFQKEVFAKKWNMLHVSEISFTVYAEDFDEFEKMSGVQLTKDFRDVTPNNENASYQGKERRKTQREKE